MAAARNVSPATIITLLPSARYFAASLPMVVVLPEPLTPATKMTKGRAVISSGVATGERTFSTSPATTAFSSSGVSPTLKRPSLSATAIWPAVSGPRSARTNSASNSSMVAESSPVFARSASASPSTAEVRLSPPLRRFSQLVLCSPSLISLSLICSSFWRARDSRFVMTPEEMLSRLLYRDGLMLVVDKPAGLSVHRGPKGGASLEDYFDVLRFGLPRRPALAHRLDKDTSGCLVLGRHRKALALLGKLFKQAKIGKTYWAVVEGSPETDEGLIDMPLGRLDESRGWWMKPDPNGLPSVTTWKVLGRSEAQGPPTSPLTWLALTPLTGRTHQLRVHCAAMGWPIAGDNIYGTAPRPGMPGAGAIAMQLHAREIVVPLYKKRDPIRVTAPVPAQM